MKRLIVLVTVAAITLLADSRYHEDFHYSFAMNPGGRLTLENFNGSVEISGWDQNSVEISGTKYADTETRLHELRIDVTNTPNRVDVHTNRTERDWHGNQGAKYVIHVPRKVVLEKIVSSNGSVRVSDIDGDINLHTSNGSVKMASIHGNVDATSSNGTVELKRAEGQMTFHTSNGSVRAESIRGAVHASTSNGSVDLEFDNAAPSNDVIASTSNGGITVRLPAATNASVNAHTSGHDRVYSDFGITVHGALAKSRLEGTIGSGGSKIELRTSNGNIHLLKS